MPNELPYKPLSNPDNLIVPTWRDYYGQDVRRKKRAQREQQKLREAQEQAGNTPD